MPKHINRLAQWSAAILLVLALLPLGGYAPTAAQDGSGIDTAALLHDSRATLYRLPTGAVPVESAVTLRFRTASGDADGVTLRLWNDFAQEQTLVPLEVITTTPEGYDLWETTIDVGRDPTIYWYRFLVSKGGETVYYEDDFRPGADQVYFPASEGGAGTVYDQSPDLSWQITVYDPGFYTPEWMRNAVIYQIFPDRFRNGDPTNDPADGEYEFYDGQLSIFHETWNEPPVDPRQPGEYAGRWNVDFFGGDLAGITEKLDYLQDLGVTAIYLNPIFEARSNHRYDTADYKAIDPILGDMQVFETLVTEAEARGIVLILDGVFNHLSSDSPFFDRYRRYEETGACESLDSPYRNWFFFVPPSAQQPAPCVDNPQGATYYISWAGYDSIPKINNEHPGPRLYFYTGRNSVVRVWGAAGARGWRLDVGGDIDGGPGTDFWEGFRVAARNVDPETVIIGEEWGNATRWLLGNEWDSVMNYRLRRGILGFVRDDVYVDNDANGDNVIHALAPSELEGLIRDLESDYPPAAYHAMMNILDSHDTSRLLFVAGDTQRQKLAALLQFALPGAPTIYYGDEIALDAPSVDDGGTLQDDPYNRAPYPWPDTEGDAYGPPDEDMLAFYQALAATRHANPALRSGEMITLAADDASGVYAFARIDRASGNVALVAANNSDTDQTFWLDFMFTLPLGLTLEPAFGDEVIDTSGGFAVLTVPANGGDIWIGSAPGAFEPLAAPANMQAQGENGGVILTWDGVEGADAYMVFRSPVASGGFERVSWIVDDEGFIDESTTNGYRYHYRVAALTAEGIPGALSDSVPAIPNAPIAATALMSDDLPQAITYGYGVTLDVAAGVLVEGETEADGPAPGVRAQAALVPPDTDDVPQWYPMTYTHDADGMDVYRAELPVPPRPAEGWQVWVRFSTNAGETWSLVTGEDGTFPALAIEAPDDTTAPDAPDGAQIVEASLAGVILSWEPSPADDVAAYRVYRTLDGETRVVADIAAADALRYHDKAVAPGNTYRYAISALDAALNESAQVPAGDALVERRRIPVTFVVTVPDYTAEGEGALHIAGDFGTESLPFWDPAGLEMEQLDAQHWTITLDLPEGATIQYKYVRGAWTAVEKGTECEEIANRTLTVAVPEGETALTVDGDVVAKWRDLDRCP